MCFSMHLVIRRSAGSSPTAKRRTGQYSKSTQRTKSRAAFVRQYLGLKWPEPHLYHAMFNTEMGESCVAAMLIQCVEQCEGAK